MSEKYKNYKYNKIMFKTHLKFLIIKHRFQSNFLEQFVISFIIFRSDI